MQYLEGSPHGDKQGKEFRRICGKQSSSCAVDSERHETTSPQITFVFLLHWLLETPLWALYNRTRQTSHLWRRPLGGLQHRVWIQWQPYHSQLCQQERSGCCRGGPWCCGTSLHCHTTPFQLLSTLNSRMAIFTSAVHDGSFLLSSQRSS